MTTLLHPSETGSDLVELPQNMKRPGRCYQHRHPGPDRHGRTAMSDPTHLHQELTARDEARFWGKADRSGDCWVWTGRIDRLGYGRFKVRGNYVMAHRLAYTIANGDPGALVVHHTCFTTQCVNPAHLAAVTQTQNVQMKNGAQGNNLSSGVRNVYRNHRGWQVFVGAGGVKHYFGTYPTIAEAAEVAERERVRLHGEYVDPSTETVTEEYIRAVEQRAEAEARVCRRGHERSSGKPCRICQRDASRRHYERSREA